MFCKTSKNKYDTMSPKSQSFVIEDTDQKLAILRAEAAETEASAKRKLFGLASSSAAPGSPPKKKKNNNKGEPVSPYAPSPPGALSPTNPGRDGSDKLKRLVRPARQGRRSSASIEPSAAGPGTLSAHKAVLKVTRFCLVRQTLLPCDQVTVLTPVLANCWSVLTPPLDCTNTSLSSGISVLTLIGGPRALRWQGLSLI